jgi:hypothetical protein
MKEIRNINQKNIKEGKKTLKRSRGNESAQP